MSSLLSDCLEYDLIGPNMTLKMNHCINLLLILTIITLVFEPHSLAILQQLHHGAVQWALCACVCAVVFELVSE